MRPPRRAPSAAPQAGFTLMEVLVATVITGMVVAVFFQLLSGSLRLQIAGGRVVELALSAEQTLAEIMRHDIRDEDFPWEGVSFGHPWELSLYGLELDPSLLDEEEQAARDEEALVTEDGEEVDLSIPQGLYGLVLRMWAGPEKQGSQVMLVRELDYPNGWFTAKFREEHLLPGAEFPYQAASQAGNGFAGVAR